VIQEGETVIMQKKRRVLALAAAVTVAAACSGSRGAVSGNSISAGPGTSTATAGSGQKFGTLDSPCGPGQATGATDQGVTNSAIHIAYGDDRGFPAQPGLNKEMGDAVKAMIKWCNDQGGILGRQVIGDFYDAAISQVNSVMQQACKTDFMLVGEGWALDEAAEGTRVACNLVAVPGFAVGPDFANGPMKYEPVPGPDDYIVASVFFQAAKLWPEPVKKADFFHTTLATATESTFAKNQEATAAAGWNLLNCGVKINYTGEPDYQPFAGKYQSCGAQLVYYNLTPGPPLFNFLTAMDQLGEHPIYVTEAADYTPEFAQWNTHHIADQTYTREAFQPIENADAVPAVKQYVDAVKAVGGSVDQLGEQAASAFLLWATQAKSCGSNLTRQCMVNALSKVHAWTGGGLHAPADPGNNKPSDCGLIMKLTGTTWAQYYPKTLGQYDCNPQYLFQISSTNWGTTLGPDRISTKFLTPNIIKPQT
jgi:ABC-type branched-subunit amino acid transport system substrate-binding protein